jgi:hypothetical protein
MKARLAVGALAIGLLTVAYRYLSFTDFSNDHFVHLSVAQQITMGALPVRDFVERGLPLMPLISAAGQVVLGEGLRSELWVIAIAFGIAAGLTFLVALQSSGSATVAALSALVPVAAYPVSYSYPKLLAPALGFAAALWYCARPDTARAVLMAATVAVAFLLRHDLGVFLGASVIAMMMAYHGVSKPTLISAARVAGIAVLIVAPYLLWVQVYEGLGTYVREGVVFSQREAQRANWWTPPPFAVDSNRPLFERVAHGPVVNVRWQTDASAASIADAESRHRLVRQALNSPQSWTYEMRRWSSSAIEQLVRDPLAADTQGIDRATYSLQVSAPTGVKGWLVNVYAPGDGMRVRPNATAALFYLVWLVPIAAVFVLARTWSTSTPTIRALVAMSLVMQFAMNLTMLRDPVETRIRDVLVPVSLLIAWLAGLAWQATLAGLAWQATPAGTAASIRPTVMRRVAAVLVLVVIVAGTAAVGDASTHIERTNVMNGIDGINLRLRTTRRVLSPPDQRTGPLAPAYRTLVTSLGRCTPPGSRLLTLTFAPEILFYTNRGFAGGHVSFSPGYYTSERDATVLLQRVSTEDVPFVILDSQTEGEMLGDYPRIGSYVRSNYHEAWRVPLTNEKAFVVLARNGSAECARLE